MVAASGLLESRDATVAEMEQAAGELDVKAPLLRDSARKVRRLCCEMCVRACVRACVDACVLFRR